MGFRLVQWSAIAVLALLAILPTAELASMPVLCMFRRVWGWECFGCGLTRALSLALHGEWAAAMEMNRLVAIVLPALAGLAVWRQR